jgi:PAS domain S-box-containing protein
VLIDRHTPPVLPRLVPRSVDPRFEVVLRIERTLLGARYVAYLLLLALIGADVIHLPTQALVAITIAALVQHSFVHTVLYTRRYDLFVTPINFFLNLLKICLIVGITGGDASPYPFLFLLLIIGYCIYVPHFAGTFRVTVVCCIAYAAVVLLHWSFQPPNASTGNVTVYYTAIIACGWLMSMIGRTLRRTEQDAHARAQALASSEATMRAILDSTPSPIVVYEENEFISEVNNRACEFLGVPRQRLIGRRFRSFLFDDGTLPNKLATLRSKGEYHGEAIAIREDGEERDIDLLVRSFMRDGRRLFVTMMHDITEQKELQEASRMAQQKLEQVNRELQQIGALRAAFFATISQRLRSPLSAILGFVDMLLHEELGETNTDQRKALQSCRRSVRRVFDLVDETLDFEVERPPDAVEPAAGNEIVKPAASGQLEA